MLEPTETLKREAMEKIGLDGKIIRDFVSQLEGLLDEVSVHIWNGYEAGEIEVVLFVADDTLIKKPLIECLREDCQPLVFPKDHDPDDIAAEIEVFRKLQKGVGNIIGDLEKLQSELIAETEKAPTE